MDGEGFDANAWGWHASSSSPADAAAARDGMDLNSQAPEEEGFPGLRLYGAFLQGDNDELPPGRVRGSGLPPYRPPRAGAGDAGATSAAPYDQQLQFGGSSSAATGDGRNNCVFPGVAQRANSAAAAPGHRNQRTNTASLGGVGQRVPRPRAPRASRCAGVLRGHVSSSGAVRGQTSGSGAVRGQSSGSVAFRGQAPSSGVFRGQAFNTSVPFDNEELADDLEELASSGGPPVSHGNRAHWNEANNACLLELCIEQRRTGMYNGTQMSGDGYQAVVDGLLARRGLVYTRAQVKNQLVILKNIHSFWGYLQSHTGLGRKPDGSIDADHEFWQTHTEKKPYLKRLLLGPPGNEELLDELFRGYTVDGSTAFVPGDDYGQNLGQDAGALEEEEFQATPTSRSSQRSQRGKRSSSSTSSTMTSPTKKTKSPMVKFVKDIASTFKESVAMNTKQMQKHESDKAACSVQRCQELAFECGVRETVESVCAMSKMFETEYQRQFFCGKITPQVRLGYFKKWCRDNNLSLGDDEE